MILSQIIEQKRRELDAAKARKPLPQLLNEIKDILSKLKSAENPSEKPV